MDKVLTQEHIKMKFVPEEAYEVKPLLLWDDCDCHNIMGCKGVSSKVCSRDGRAPQFWPHYTYTMYHKGVSFRVTLDWPLVLVNFRMRNGELDFICVTVSLSWLYLNFIWVQTHEGNCVDKVWIKSRYPMFILTLSSHGNALSWSLYEEEIKSWYPRSFSHTLS